MIERGDWQVSDVARNAFDLEGKIVGTIGAGRIGYRVLQRLAPFDCKELLYYDYAPLPEGERTLTITIRIPLIRFSLHQLPPRPSTLAASLTSRSSSLSAMSSLSTAPSTKVPVDSSTLNFSSTSRREHGS